MQALGFIETRGLIAAIESADAMLKAAEVRLVERTFVKGGIVTITVTGDVAACRASVDAAASAVARMGGTILSTHVIPRPHESLDGLIIGSVETFETEPEASEEEKPDQSQESEAKKSGANRAYVESTVETDGIDRAISLLKRFRTAEIKEMFLGEYPETNLSSESVENMTKKELLDWLKDFYTE